MNSENMSSHSSTKSFGKFQYKLRPADENFFSLYMILGENWKSADVMTFFLGLHSILGGKLDICGCDDPQRTCLPFA